MSPQPPFWGVSRRALLSAFAALPVLSISARAQTAASGDTTAASGDTLPSWNEGATKQAILNFVTAVTREGSPDFVSPDERMQRSITMGPYGWNIRCTPNWLLGLIA